MKVADVLRIIEWDGWVLVRTRGSHRQFEHTSKPGTVTVAGKPSAEVPRGYTELDPPTSRFEKVRPVAMRYAVVLERGESGWGAHVPDLPGCIAAAETREEVLDLIREAIEFHIEGLRKEGLPVPEPVSEGEVVEIGAV